MSADRIEREIDIDAPIEVVWEVVTSPRHITGWFVDAAELELRPSGAGRFSWDEKATNRAAVVNVRVETVDPPHRFAFRWDFPTGAMPDETNAPLVEFALEEHGGGTRVTIVESGLATISRSDEARAAYFDDHAKGWPQIGARLRAYAASQAGAVAT